MQPMQQTNSGSQPSTFLSPAQAFVQNLYSSNLLPLEVLQPAMPHLESVIQTTASYPPSHPTHATNSHASYPASYPQQTPQHTPQQTPQIPQIPQVPQQAFQSRHPFFLPPASSQASSQAGYQTGSQTSSQSSNEERPYQQEHFSEYPSIMSNMSNVSNLQNRNWNEQQPWQQQHMPQEKAFSEFSDQHWDRGGRPRQRDDSLFLKKQYCREFTEKQSCSYGVTCRFRHFASLQERRIAEKSFLKEGKWGFSREPRIPTLEKTRGRRQDQRREEEEGEGREEPYPRQTRDGTSFRKERKCETPMCTRFTGRSSNRFCNPCVREYDEYTEDSQASNGTPFATQSRTTTTTRTKSAIYSPLMVSTSSLRSPQL